jgi:nitrous oxide reductase
MPTKISRRRFMRDASVGAVAAGAVATGGASLLAPAAGAATTHAAAHTATTHGSEVRDGSGLIAHVTDARKGEISILVGEREIRYTNRDMAQQLLRAAK